MQAQEKIERTFARFRNDEDQLSYPDFDAMWNRIEPQLPRSKEQLLPVVQQAAGRTKARRTVLIAATVVLAVATPVVAMISYNWDNYLYRNGGIRTALLQGLGQSIEKSVELDGVKLTVHTAVVDEHRTVLLFSVKAPKTEKPEQIVLFAEMSLQSAGGENIVGTHRLMWNEEAQVWLGTFEAQWTPETALADVQLTARNLQWYSAVEEEIPFQMSEDRLQSFDLNKDGIRQIAVRPLDQRDNVMLVSSVFFDDPEVKTWASPSIGVYKGSEKVNEAMHGYYGRPGEHGEYTFQQFYKAEDLADASAVYKLRYTKKDREVGGDWSLDLHLDKQQMQGRTMKRELNIPIESGAGKMTLNSLIVTPISVKIKATHEKHQQLIFRKHHLEVDGIKVQNGNTFQPISPEETDFYFEVPPTVKMTEHTPIDLVMSYEVIEHEDEQPRILLKDISEEKKTITTQLGGFPVQWTYYRDNGDLYVQSESADPRFGGVNQTYLIQGEETIPGRQVTTNMTGDGINRAIDVYKNFREKDALISIYFYTTDNPEKELRVKLNQ